MDKPIVLYDLETTGTDYSKDKIVEFYALKMSRTQSGEWGYTEELHIYINPEMPIPAGATAIHGITDEMVANELTFKEAAPIIATFFEGCDIGGYNNRGFDDIVLCEEFSKTDVTFSLEGRLNLDFMQIWFKHEPRTLSGAYLRFTEKTMEGAHQASNDVKVLVEMFNNLHKLKGLEAKTAAELHDSIKPDVNSIDPEGNFVRNENGEIDLMFGKYKPGQEMYKPFSWVMKYDKQYLTWILEKSSMSSCLKYYLRKLMTEKV